MSLITVLVVAVTVAVSCMTSSNGSLPPCAHFQYEGCMEADKECVCHAYFKNPLPMPLTRGWFIIQGAGLTDVQFLRHKE